MSAKAALEAYVTDVRSGRFPEPQHTYDMAEGEAEIFKARALKACQAMKAQGSEASGKIFEPSCTRRFA